MKIDLHAHSRCSDGTQSPAELVAAAAKAQLDVVALTDHDTTAGWEEAEQAAHAHGVAVVPGMEISCQTSDGITVHLLCYLHDRDYAPLLEEIRKSKDARLSRAARMAALLAEDYPVSWADVTRQLAPGATVGRPHLADALVQAGVVHDRAEAFETILTPQSKYFVQHYAPAPERAVELVRQAGGVPVFAHPMASARGRVVGQSTFESMIDAGLAGVEVWHRDNPPEGREFLLNLARKHNLLVTGSSDYHGSGKPNELGENLTELGQWELLRAQGRGTLFGD